MVLLQPFDSNVLAAVVVVVVMVMVVVVVMIVVVVVVVVVVVEMVVMVVVVAAAVFVITCFSQHTASASPFRRVSHRCSADCHSFTLQQRFFDALQIYDGEGERGWRIESGQQRFNLHKMSQFFTSR